MDEHKIRYTKGSTQYIGKDCEEKTQKALDQSHIGILLSRKTMVLCRRVYQLE